MEKEVKEFMQNVEAKALEIIQDGQRHCMKTSAQGQYQLIAIDSARKAFLYASERFDMMAEEMKKMTERLDQHLRECHERRD